MSNEQTADKQLKDQFVLTFPIKRPIKAEERILKNRFNIAHKIKNKLTEHAIELIKQYENDKRLTEAIEKYKNKQITKKELNDLRKTIQKELNLSEFGFTNLATKVGNELGYKKVGLGSGILQNVSKEVWTATERYLFKDGQKIKFKKYYDFRTLRNKTNDYAPKLVWHREKNIIHAHIVYGDLILNLKPIKKQYELLAFERARVHSVGIKRLPINTGWRYFAQILFQGVKPQKHILGNGKVGLDLGPSKVAVVSDEVVEKIELFSNLDNLPSQRAQSGKGPVGLVGCRTVDLSTLFLVENTKMRESWRHFHKSHFFQTDVKCPKMRGGWRESKLKKKIARIQRALDRSCRATNPDNFNPDGTLKPKAERKPWVFSNRYKKLKGRLSALSNKIVEMRKISHNKLANQVLALGNHFVVEDLNLQAWAMLKKETTVNEKTGRFNSKRRWGRQIHNKAPGLWVSILGKKVKSLGGVVERIDAKKYKASQYRHDVDDYIKVGLEVREFEVDGVIVDRDLYSAFVLKCGANRDIMIREWNKFKTLANGCDRLKGQ